MPVPWLPCEAFLPALPPAPGVSANVATSIQQSQSVTVDDFLTVTSARWRFDVATNTYTFEEGVVARYGPTLIHADRLVVDRANQRAEASGNVALEDPEATLSADRLEFSWKPETRSGRATNVYAQIADITLRAREALISPDRYELIDVSGSSCGRERPFYAIHTPRLVVTPGRNARVERPSISVLGRRILTVPTRNFNLDPRTEGFQLPTFSYRRNGRFGATWNSGFLLDNQTNLSLNATSFGGIRPGYGAVLIRSYLPAERATDIVTPMSELSERFRFGYLENVQVRTPDQEQRFLRNLRKSAGVSSTFNQGVVGRRDELSFSKPIEVVGELGGSAFESGGYIAQGRIQNIRRGSEASTTRLVLSGSALAPQFELGPKLKTLFRADASTFTGEESYGWVRGLLGVVYEPHPALRLSAGGVFVGEAGTPRYPNLDPPFAKDGYVFRADLNLGPTKVSYMEKWDRRMGTYDREYYISQVVGCFEPFVLNRRYPGEYQLGVRFRLDNFYDVLRRREFKRTKTAPTYIEPEPNPPTR